MKNLLLILFAALSLNAHAQWNKKWTTLSSISGGIYESKAANIVYNGHAGVITAGNEYFEPTHDSIKGVVRSIDSTGTVQWTTVLSPAVSLVNFSNGGIVNNLGSETWHGIVAYNTTPTTSHLIKINPNGTIAWDIIVNGINNISSICDDTSGIWLVGRTPQTTCGAFQCNGIAVAKYNSSGQLQWKKTRYATGGYFTMPSQIVLDSTGNVIESGKKAAVATPNDYNPFIAKYSPTGSALWSKEFNDAATDVPYSVVVTSLWGTTLIPVAYTTSDLITSAKKAILKKLDASTGNTLWTKTIINAEVNGVSTSVGSDIILSTSAGMKAYNSTGTLLWSNGFRVSTGGTSLTPGVHYADIIATNVNPLEPLSNYLVQLDESTGAVLMQKNLSIGNHFEYEGDYLGYGIYGESGVMLIKDTTPPYGTRVTKLSPCSDFTYSYSASTTITNVSGATCNNGAITVNWIGNFNSWAHLEIYDDNTNLNIAQADVLSATTYTFQNLTSGNYTVKMFDESCGEQDFNVTVKCPIPSSGFAVSFPMPSGGNANLSWNAPSCASGYKVQYSSNGGVSWTTVTTNTNSKTLTGLTLNATYKWRVSTKCSGSSPAVYTGYSAIQTFTMPSQRLGETQTAVSNYEEMNLDIYPNPANDVLTVESAFENTTPLKIKIMDVTGRELISFTEHAQEGMWQKEINLSKLLKGVYVLRMEGGEGMIGVRRFVKE